MSVCLQRINSSWPIHILYWLQSLQLFSGNVVSGDFRDELRDW